MTDLQLILKIKFHGEARCRVRRAARITLDRDRLTLVAPNTLALEAIPLPCIKALRIQSVAGTRPSLWPSDATLLPSR